MTNQTLSTEALAVLREMECDTDRARMTSGQLERPLYEEVNEVLVRLGGKWKGGRTRAHLFPYDPRPLLAAVLKTGEMPPKNPWAFFPTPPPLVETVMTSPLFERLQDGDLILEPSAGQGALAEGMRARLAHLNVQIDCCEISAPNQQVLCTKGFEMVCDDFLAYHPEKRYRAIVMNPPFTLATDRTAYITHIRHAWELVAEDGFLIAFAPSGYTFRSDKKSYDFLSFVLTYGTWEELPARSFHESGTDSAVTLITLEKRDQSWRYTPYNGCPTWYCWEMTLLADNNNDELYQAREQLFQDLRDGKCCTDPHLPAWKETQKTIRSYYQRVIEDARKHEQLHIEIRPQDWSFLEQRFMMDWDDTWGARDQEQVSISSPDEQPVSDRANSASTGTTSLETPSTGSDQPTGDPPVRDAEKAPPVTGSTPATGTPIYSPLPYDAMLSYEQRYAIFETNMPSREDYLPLPWCLEELIGTVWRNLHTGEARTVHHIERNRFDRPMLCSVPATSSHQEGQSMEVLGFWSGDRYLVEDWTRIDQQSQEDQLRWFGIERSWLRTQMAFCDKQIARCRWDLLHRTLYRRIKQEHERRLQQSEADLRTFAATHHLAVPVEILNSGISGSESAPVQMALL